MASGAPRPSQRSPQSFDPSEPRRPQLVVPYAFPHSATLIKASDALSMAALCCDAICMVTRFPMWGWLGLLLSVASLRTTKALLQPKEASTSFSALSCIMFSVTAMSSVYLPVLQGVAEKAPLSTNPFTVNGGLIPF